MAKNRYRTKPKIILFTENELEILEKNMEVAHTTNFSLYARKMLLDGVVVHKDFRELRNLVHELNRIGVNINQIAKKANETESVVRHDVNLLRENWKELLFVLNEQFEVRIKEGDKGNR
jgi:hypothetical protein